MTTHTIPHFKFKWFLREGRCLRYSELPWKRKEQTSVANPLVWGVMHVWGMCLTFYVNTFLTLSATPSTSPPPILVMLSFTRPALFHSLTACFSLCLFVSLHWLIMTCPSTGTPLTAPPTSSSHPPRSCRRCMKRWRLAERVREKREEQRRYLLPCARAKDEEEKQVERARRGKQSAHDTLAFMESITGPIMMQITMCTQGEVVGAVIWAACQRRWDQNALPVLSPGGIMGIRQFAFSRLCVKKS